VCGVVFAGVCAMCKGRVRLFFWIFALLFLFFCFFASVVVWRWKGERTGVGRAGALEQRGAMGRAGAARGEVVM